MSVSIIIPSYNHHAFLSDAIQSVIKQSFEKFEIIIIDDGSTDNSWKVIKSFTDNRIRCYKLTSNHGADYVQNEGIKLAEYDYIAILNSDDIFFENRIEKCLNCIEKKDVDIVGTDIELIDCQSNIIRKNWWTEAFDVQKNNLKENLDWFKSLFSGNLFMTSSNFFFKKSIFYEIGGFNSYRYVLDYDFLLRALLAGKSFYWIDEPLLKYRLHDRNTISSVPLEANKEAFELISNIMSQLPVQNYSLGESIKAGVVQLNNFNINIQDALSNNFQKSIDISNIKIAERDQWIAERDQWIAERDQWISDRDETIHLLSTELINIKSNFIYKLLKMFTYPFRLIFRL